MAASKKGNTKNPGSPQSEGTPGISVVKTKKRLRKEKFEQLKEKYGTKSRLELGDGIWYKTNHLNEMTSMTIPVKINSDLTRENFTSIVMKVEEAAEKIVSAWPGSNPVISTGIEAFEYAKNIVGSKPLDQPGKENELERTMNGTPGVPLGSLTQVFSTRLRRYLKGGGFTYFSTIIVNIRDIKEEGPKNWARWAQQPAWKRPKIT